MKSYSQENYETFKAFKVKFLEEFIDNFMHLEVIVKSQKGTIVEFTMEDTSLGDTIMSYISINNEIKKYAFIRAIAAGVIQTSEEVKIKVNELSTIYNDGLETYGAECISRDDKLREENELRLEEVLAKEEEQKELNRLEKRRQKYLKKLDELVPFKHFKDEDQLIEWIKKHLKKVSATMPTYIEPWFVKKFGDVSRKVVDEFKKTSGGYKMKWSLSMTATFDEAVPSNIARYTSTKNHKTITNLKFILSLADTYSLDLANYK